MFITCTAAPSSTFAAVKWSLFAIVLWVQGSIVSPDLARLPALFMHFLRHRTEQPGLDPLAFLAAHYGARAEAEREQPGHDMLPFHHHHHEAMADHCEIKLITTDPSPAVSFPDASNTRSHVPLPDDGVSSGFRSSLLQPPRPLA